MQIEFSAYADDYTVRGEVMLEAARLSDWLGTAYDFDVTDLKLRALEDGREHVLDSAQIRREELCVVAATGPRGRPDRRIRTRAYPMRVVAGPYSIVGYFQALPTADPWTVVQRRQIIALTPARLSFDIAGERVEQTHAALLVMHAKIESMDDATDAEVGLSNALGSPAVVGTGAEAVSVDADGRDR